MIFAHMAKLFQLRNRTFLLARSTENYFRTIPNVTLIVTITDAVAAIATATFTLC